MIIEIKPKKEKSERLRALIRGSIKAAIDGLGDKISGYALMVWDGRGKIYSSISTEHGPISQELLPTFIHDALNRHVSLNLMDANVLREIEEEKDE
jgi:hypothetical protein